MNEIILGRHLGKLVLGNKRPSKLLPVGFELFFRVVLEFLTVVVDEVLLVGLVVFVVGGDSRWITLGDGGLVIEADLVAVLDGLLPVRWGTDDFACLLIEIPD
jgi:hypothetical protein